MGCRISTGVYFFVKKRTTQSAKSIFIFFAILACLFPFFSTSTYAATTAYIGDTALPLQEEGYREWDYRGSGTCWAFAQHVYWTLWGTAFTQDIRTEDDMLRYYPFGECRRITAENAEYLISRAENGSVIRLQTDPTLPDTAEQHRHSLILVSKDDNGCVLYHAWDSYVVISYYTWQQFEDVFNRRVDFGYFKYIKYPNAKAVVAKNQTALSDFSLGRHFSVTSEENLHATE